MHIFYTPDISGKFYFLDKEESRHCIKVLRLKIGVIIQLIDGSGGFYEAKIISENHKKCEIEITKKTENYGKRNQKLSIAIAPTKNISRYEWFLEKVTEIGIDEILPFTSFHSERKNIKNERLEKVVVSAIKQSIKTYKPELYKLQSFNNLIKMDFEGQKFIAYCKTDNHLKNEYKTGSNALVLIGPEGGFSEQEVELAKDNGFKPISLSNSRLRTETAGIIVASIFDILN